MASGNMDKISSAIEEISRTRPKQILIFLTYSVAKKNWQ
jgi:hypothetical protein